MSSMENVKVTCPKCSTEQEALIWNSLNVQLSPEAKDDFLEGKINVMECKSCHFQATLTAPFLYHDMLLKFCVQYYPVEYLDNEEFLEGLKPYGSSVGPAGELDRPENRTEEARYLFYPHIVFNMQEAMIYVAFREMLAAVHEDRAG